MNIFWFRNDLRISYNQCLFEALKNSKAMLIYIHDESSQSPKVGSASKFWLHHSLEKLNQSLHSKLNIYLGDTKDTLMHLIRENTISAIYSSTQYNQKEVSENKEIEHMLNHVSVNWHQLNTSLICDPVEILKPDKTPYKRYSDFYKKFTSKIVPKIIDIEQSAKNANSFSQNQIKFDSLIKDNANKTTLASLNLLNSKKQYKISAGEIAAQEKLNTFLKDGLNAYKENRNYAAKLHATSQLSTHLHFGEISANEIWQNITKAENYTQEDKEQFLNEIAWREFSHYLLYHFPHISERNFQSKWDAFPWTYDKKLFDAWKNGETGYPIVDAGMKELIETGHMHNRVRMIVASFLTKNLLIHWKYGMNWFWENLLDADLANNSANWQWVAGSGSDSMFRVFNPVIQGEKFDKDGGYTLKYIPVLATLPRKFLFKPWEATDEILRNANIRLGKNYPKPIIDIKNSRKIAIEEYIRCVKNVKKKSI